MHCLGFTESVRAARGRPDSNDDRLEGIVEKVTELKSY